MCATVTENASWAGKILPKLMGYLVMLKGGIWIRHVYFKFCVLFAKVFCDHFEKYHELTILSHAWVKI